MVDAFVCFIFLLLPPLFVFLFVFSAVSSQRGSAQWWCRYPAISVWTVLLLLSLILLGGEIYYRFYYDSTDSFGLARVTQRWFSRHYQNNAVGARDNIEYFTQRKPGTERITFLGDSFTAGHGVADVEKRFANLIRASKKGQWEIHVLARNGFDTGPEISLFASALQGKYPLGLVVLVYCLNDVSDLNPAWQAVFDRIYKDSDKLPFLIKYSYFLNTWYFRLRAMSDPDISNYYHFVKDCYSGPVWEAQQERLDILRKLVVQNGGRMAVVTFPFLHALGPGYEYLGIHEKLDTFWQDLKIPHLDLLSIYESYPPSKLVVNRYDAHPNEFAQQLAAEAVQKFLEKQIEKAVPDV